MAKTNNFDELNTMRSDKEQVEEEITKYFEEMELPEQEIKRRIQFAIDLEDAFERLFLLAYAMSKVDKYDKEFLKAYLLRDYVDAMERNGYDNPERAEFCSTSVVDTTLAHLGTIYYLSIQRAIECAETESNAVGNAADMEQALADGKMFKRWHTMLDNRVRKSHMKVDGIEMPIEEPFIVGGYQMMFPMDQSMGAHEKECINCRCSLEYF